MDSELASPNGSHLDSNRPAATSAAAIAGDDFSDLARQRREEAAKQAAEPPPNFILGIESSELTVVLDPKAVPLKYIDPALLLSLTESHYSASLDTPDLGALIRATSLDLVQRMEPMERLKAAWELPEASVEFNNGRLPTKYGFVPIRNIYIDFEKVIVRVQGITTLAEAVAYEILEVLWRSAGVERKYSELEDLVRLTTYATATTVDLGESARHLLGGRFLRYFQESFAAGGKFTGAFGSRSHRHDFKPPSNVVSSVTLDELHLQVSRFDIDTGTSYTGTLRFSVKTRDDHGTGRMLVASHLPYSDHVALLGALREELAKET